jgi:peroxiredoxin
MPSIEKLFEKYGDKIKIILISQENPQTVNAFLKKNEYTLPTYISDGSVPEIFKSRSIPTSFLISPEGKIVLKKKGAAKWNSRKVEKLIDKMITNK